MSEDENRILNALLAGGYTPDSAADYVRTHDLADLRHTGTLSVQLDPARRVRCQVRKWNGEWHCMATRDGVPGECRPFPTWADAYQHALERTA